MEETAEALATLILEGFNRHFAIFTDYNRRAAHYFETADFLTAYDAAKEQVDLYDQRVSEATSRLQEECDMETLNEPLWQAVKICYMHKLYEHPQPELAESFYNSVFCKLFNRRYYNNSYIFFNPAIDTALIQSDIPDYRSYYPDDHHLEDEIERLLLELPINLPFEDLARDRDNIIGAIERYRQNFSGLSNYIQIHILTPILYRNKSAYAVGRIMHNNHSYPFVIALFNREGKLYVDAFLNEEADIVNIFSFSRAYFKAEFNVPSAIVRFLKTIIPSKHIADWYTILGFHKQGKNEFYRYFLYHLRHSTDQFEVAPGIAGLVMFVFTLDSYPYVYKLIKDPEYIYKDVTPKQVQEKYHKVKRTDRVGRMADVWEFSHVAFPLARFSEDCLTALKKYCQSNISIEGELLIIKHLFIERRMIPLNSYLDQIKTGNPEEKRRIVKDYGRSIKDIATAGLFPGDLLTKNFGVTRHGRVVFYDYDEIVSLSKCRFRVIPKAQNNEDQYSSQPWYTVYDDDIFPEEFATYLISDPELKAIFLEEHADLCECDYWNGVQEKVNSNVLPDILPYACKHRFSSHAN